MKRLFGLFAALFALFAAAAHASTAAQIEQIERLAAAQDFNALCRPWVLDIARGAMDENLLSTYAHACAKMDYINRLSVPIALLRSSAEGRQNAVIFATLIYKKKLLQAALIDGMDISAIALPRLDYSLSEVYDEFIAGSFVQNGGVYELEREDVRYRLWAERSKQPARVMLEVTRGGKTTLKEFY